MRFPVFSAPVNPAVDSPLCRKSRAYIEALLGAGDAFLVDPNDFKAGVQLLKRLAPESIVESLGLGNLIPFSRVQNPLCKPDSPSYPIPAVGARTRPLHCQTSLFYREAISEFRAAQRAAAS